MGVLRPASRAMNPILSFIGNLLTGGSSTGESPLSKLIGLIPDANARAAAKEAYIKEMMELAAAANTGQLQINLEEAKSSSLFVAGWRPAVGWVCGFALAYQFVLQPLIAYGISIYSTYSHNPVPPLPTLDTGSLITVLMAMLGLGGMRTFEKINGVSRDGLDEPSKQPTK